MQNLESNDSLAQEDTEPDYDALVNAGMHPDDAREFVRINAKEIGEWTVDDAEAMRILRARYKHLFDTVSNANDRQETLALMHATLRRKASHMIPAQGELSSAA